MDILDGILAQQMSLNRGKKTELRSAMPCHGNLALAGKVVISGQADCQRGRSSLGVFTNFFFHCSIVFLFCLSFHYFILFYALFLTKQIHATKA